METFFFTPGWSQHHQPSSGRALGHLRSLSSVAAASQSTPSSPAPQKPRIPLKSPSTPQLPTISLTPSHSSDLSDDMSTLPDPRNRPKTPDDDEPEPGRKHHPDLDGEVATLSTKLINAINHQTLLDDTLSVTRLELAAAKDHIRQLEAQNATMRDTLRGHVWIRRSTLDAEKKAMQTEKKAIQAKMAEETAKRLETEKEKRKIEQELENLTTALFEEANKMVIAAKEDAQAQHDALQRKIDQLKAQLADSESLLKSQQEQLSELKRVMESMASEQDDQTYGTAPPSPAMGKSHEPEHDGRALSRAAGTVPPSPFVETCAPCPPTSLHHLLHPVLRTDLTAYHDFLNLARLSHNRNSPGRGSSTSVSGFNALGLSFGTRPSSASAKASLGPSAQVQADQSAPQSPNTPASAASSGSAGAPTSPPLKESRFYKRALVEDIEPTLRLDLAPGLSWLARRTVLGSMAEGSLIVEPVPASASATHSAVVKPQLHPCALCGESRNDARYLRNHRFRTSEAESAQRYPLCQYCLNRVRSTCDYLGFLRLVRDGHWRADGEDQEKAAWEESVKLRDQMFWARVGGGVVPHGYGAPADGERSSRTSHESEGSRKYSTDAAGSTLEKEPASPNNYSTEAAGTAHAKEPTSLGPENLCRASMSKTAEPRTPPEQTDSGCLAGAAVQSLEPTKLDDPDSPGSTPGHSITV
ncbi:uncharacterized protein UV8b_05915 [Ustilaginoidea virens]|uniref:GDP/GTP exchange factor Sec2 N-terminal domain-containing protein n=2 Tax=Ustilaginoidea virens TaxID=1159556 RepID=A0A8E5HUC9_USTVR|nr:uncharacterized protein UV8b_05915 [Ustilaginoidea virens]QUC21672.1 hypothetical protein UV8b_05915 [Ustilaginoidea virens]